MFSDRQIDRIKSHALPECCTLSLDSQGHCQSIILNDTKHDLRAARTDIPSRASVCLYCQGHCQRIVLQNTSQSLESMQDAGHDPQVTNRGIPSRASVRHLSSAKVTAVTTAFSKPGNRRASRSSSMLTDPSMNTLAFRLAVLHKLCPVAGCTGTTG